MRKPIHSSLRKISADHLFILVIIVVAFIFCSCENGYTNKTGATNVAILHPTKQELSSARPFDDTGKNPFKKEKHEEDTLSNPFSCDPALWKHIYHSYRLKIIESCLTVSGTIEAIRHEKDGDDHILLRLDSGQENLLNQKNISAQHGDLVLETIYVGKVTQPDAIENGRGYTNMVIIPHVGDHVMVTGSYVLDKDHGWMEIHPVSNITIDGYNNLDDPTIHPGDSVKIGCICRDGTRSIAT